MRKVSSAQIALLAMLAIPLCAQGAICKVDDAVVTSVMQWDDGNIFVTIDKATGCGCSIDSQAAFHKDDNQKFFVTAALTALATGKKVF